MEDKCRGVRWFFGWLNKDSVSVSVSVSRGRHGQSQKTTSKQTPLASRLDRIVLWSKDCTDKNSVSVSVSVSVRLAVLASPNHNM
jgi:hypothetical protein